MPTVTRLRRSERRALIKDELVAAAAVVIARKGYRAASVAEIAAEAGYTIGAIYSNFSGKRALFDAVFDRQVDQQFALACALELPRPMVVLSAGSDGIDGNSPAAGAVADATTAARSKALGIDPAASLARFDAYPLFAALGDALVTGPTHNNLRDLRIMLSAT